MKKFFESFSFGLDNWDSVGTDLSGQSGGYNGRLCAKGTVNEYNWTKILESNSEYRFGLRVNVIPNCYIGLTFYDAATVNAKFYWNNTPNVNGYRRFQILDAASNVTYWTIPASYDGIWTFIEGYVLFSDSGNAKIKVNGQQVASVSADFKGGANATSDRFKLTLYGTGGAAWFINDLYVSDEAFFYNDVEVLSVYPVSDVLQGLSRSTGSNNYALVGDGSDSTYVYKDSAGVDKYNFGNQGLTRGAVLGIQTRIKAKKETADAAVVHVHSGVYGSSDTLSVGNEIVPTTNYVETRDLILVDPDTTEEFTLAEVNDLNAGITLE